MLGMKFHAVFLPFILGIPSLCFSAGELAITERTDYISHSVASSTAQVSGFVSFWVQVSSGSFYSLPVPFKKNVPVKLEIGLYETGGYVDIKKFETSAEGLTLKARFISVCPYADKAKCEGRYFAVDAELSGQTKAFCGGYFDEKDFLPFPVFFCSGYVGSNRLGVTFHREKY